MNPKQRGQGQNIKRVVTDEQTVGRTEERDERFPSLYEKNRATKIYLAPYKNLFYSSDFV